MTKSSVPVDDPTTLKAILSKAEAVLLDFDGPICSVFAGLPANIVAAQLRDVLKEGAIHDIPPHVENSADPFDVLAFAASIGDNEARLIEASLRALEAEAVATAEPTPGAHKLIEACHRSGRKLAIVSNNGSLAVESYLHRFELTQCIDNVSARIEADPSLLKPDPFLLLQAQKMLGVSSPSCVFIGDSTTDTQAAKAASIASIAFANKPEKFDTLARQFPDSIITRISILGDLFSTPGGFHWL